MGLSRRRWRTSSAGVLLEEVLVGPAALEYLDALHALLDRFWAAVNGSRGPRPLADQRTAFITGLIEIASNIIRYAYPPLSAGKIEIRLRLHRDRVEALLTDWGQPFVEPETLAPDWSDELPESGLGLSLARRALDRVEYDRDSSGRNHWWLVKLL